MGFDRASFGSVVLSSTQAVGTDIQLELSVGSYENEPISNYSEGSIFAQMGRSVGRLDVLTDKGVFPCTAFIVSKKYILTNYHCSLGILDNERIGATQIQATQFVAGYTRTGIDEGTKKYMVIPQPVETNKALDYAVLEVMGDPSQQFGQLKLASAMPTDGDPFWIIGHPMGEGQRISREKCKANAPAVSAGKLLHTCDTLPGNSGSPVIDAGLQQVVALHHAGSQKDSVNFAILMSEILENSTVLAAYKAPEATPKNQPVEPKTAANSACDALYRAAAEAKACYAYDAYVNSCSSHSLAPIAEGYINEFCKPQETVDIDKLSEKICTDDPSLCNDSLVSGQQATDRYAATGVWVKAPTAPYFGAVLSLSGDLHSSIDSGILSYTPVSLPNIPESRGDLIPDKQSNPPVFGQTFSLNKQGLVVATVAGSLSQEGHLVYLGSPRNTPQTKGEQVIRPKLRPASVRPAEEVSEVGTAITAVTNSMALKSKPISLASNASKTDWAVFIEPDPLECWSVAAPEKSIARKAGRVVSVKRGDVLLMITFRPGQKISGQIGFTGGYPLKEGSKVEVIVDGRKFQFETSGSWAWPQTEAADAKVMRAFQTGRYVTIKGSSTRGTITEDTFSLLGYTGAKEDAASRCKKK